MEQAHIGKYCYCGGSKKAQMNMGGTITNIDRFNRTYREAVLDAYLFHTVAEVQAITQDWLEEYNAIRPHEVLGQSTVLSIYPKTVMIFPISSGTNFGPFTTSFLRC